MKFSDVSREDWNELAPYLDTCLLPVSGLDGSEEPWEAREALEALRDALELLEIPFRGRIVTYPALHYSDLSSGGELLGRVCARLKSAGFRYVIVLTASPKADIGNCPEADLVLRIVPEEGGTVSQFGPEVSRLVRQLWNPPDQGQDGSR